VQVWAALDLDEAVARVLEQPDDLPGLQLGIGVPGLLATAARAVLELTLHCLERPGNHGIVVVLGFTPLGLALADDRVAPGNLDLDRDADRRLAALGAAVRNLHHDAATDHIRVEPVQFLCALPDERVEKFGRLQRLVCDLQRPFHVELP